MFLRVGGAGYQYVTGRLKQGYFHVHDGMLLQNPFSEGCLREVDIILLSSCYYHIELLITDSINCYWLLWLLFFVLPCFSLFLLGRRR